MLFSKNMTIISSLAFLLLVATGCESIHTAMRPKPHPMSAFLPQQNKLDKQPAIFPFQYFWVGDDLKKYHSIYIAPVSTDYLEKGDAWAELDHKLAGTLQSDIHALADYMRQNYIQAFEKHKDKGDLKVVSTPAGEDCLVLETAIIAIVPTKAELNTLGLAGDFFLPGISIVFSMFAEGSIAIECRVKNAATNEIVAMYADNENDPAAVIPIAGLSWLSSAKNNIRALAEQTAEVFNSDDRQSVKRGAPIKFITY